LPGQDEAWQKESPGLGKPRLGDVTTGGCLGGLGMAADVRYVDATRGRKVHASLIFFWRHLPARTGAPIEVDASIVDAGHSIRAEITPGAGVV
jgi:hypothetical protein